MTRTAHVLYGDTTAHYFVHILYCWFRESICHAGVFTCVLSENRTVCAVTANVSGNVCACHLSYLQNNDTKLNICQLADLLVTQWNKYFTAD